MDRRRATTSLLEDLAFTSIQQSNFQRFQLGEPPPLYFRSRVTFGLEFKIHVKFTTKKVRRRRKHVGRFCPSTPCTRQQQLYARFVTIQLLVELRTYFSAVDVWRPRYTTYIISATFSRLGKMIATIHNTVYA